MKMYLMVGLMSCFATATFAQEKAFVCWNLNNPEEMVRLRVGQVRSPIVLRKSSVASMKVVSKQQYAVVMDGLFDANPDRAVFSTYVDKEFRFLRNPSRRGEADTYRFQNLLDKKQYDCNEDFIVHPNPAVGVGN